MGPTGAPGFSRTTLVYSNANSQIGNGTNFVGQGNAGNNFRQAAVISGVMGTITEFSAAIFDLANNNTNSIINITTQECPYDNVNGLPINHNGPGQIAILNALTQCVTITVNPAIPVTRHTLISFRIVQSNGSTSFSGALHIT